ncbi:hypothetical protein B0T26DRAFT_750904 [Lasiosphaeria miniovina]|uniref:Nucleoside phosphorylase domain-containing protein n=1 Tax=Lasiosphaeria miniovina TaxID=1954250 RepID=A0AA40AJA0_9PEZI|nr:uncharacterized protein B0T26DRAFT_750904 [Lasiosphaeria miniovina]KAK0716760.1 hypothetical protein B0T26DRAFT_750904 [Lasiosphaeria miniovina]
MDGGYVDLMLTGGNDNKSFGRLDFKVAIICALKLEYEAAILLFNPESIWDQSGHLFGRLDEDDNTYMHGRIGDHNIVPVLLPGQFGKVSAARVTTELIPGAGGAGGIDVLLGGVIVSTSVVQYDFGQYSPDRFHIKDTMKDNDILGMLETLDTGYGRAAIKKTTATLLQDLHRRDTSRTYTLPAATQDNLYRPSCRHKHRGAPTCECLNTTANGDSVCKLAIELSCEDLGCEEESACDYAASHKNKTWQLYAAATPASTARAILERYEKTDRITPSLLGTETFATNTKPTESSVASMPAGAGVHISAVTEVHVPTGSSSATTVIATISAGAETAVGGPEDEVDQESAATWPVPFSLKGNLINRPEILKPVMERYEVGQRRVALVGLGGIGKSQLAIKIAQEAKKPRSQEARKPGSQEARKPGSQEARKPGSQEARKTSRVFWVDPTTRCTTPFAWFTAGLWREENGWWTIILDNANDESVFFSGDPMPADFLPSTSNGSILVTSTNEKVAQMLTGGQKNVIRVRGTSEEEAVHLFKAL